MRNKRNMSSRYHKFIKTKHVFIEGDRLYFKKEDYNHHPVVEGIVQWFPVDFQVTP
ncbi:MAG: hypothetical protein ACR2MT_10675 [Aurantibacter sp.]